MARWRIHFGSVDLALPLVRTVASSGFESRMARALGIERWLQGMLTGWRWLPVSCPRRSAGVTPAHGLAAGGRTCLQAYPSSCLISLCSCF